VFGVAVTVGVGCTVTTKLNGWPTQNVVEGPVGVITYVTDPSTVPELTRISEMAPEPFVLKPVTLPLVREAVHAKVVPVTADDGV
jgi:hypothetical protein